MFLAWHERCKTAHHMSLLRRLSLIAAAFVWVAAVGVGFTMLMNYSVKPGAPALAPKQWPGSRIPAPQGQFLLVMTIHPHARAPAQRHRVEQSDGAARHQRRLCARRETVGIPGRGSRRNRFERRHSIEVLVDVDGVESSSSSANVRPGAAAGPDGGCCLPVDHARSRAPGRQPWTVPDCVAGANRPRMRMTAPCSV